MVWFVGAKNKNFAKKKDGMLSKKFVNGFIGAGARVGAGKKMHGAG